MANERGDDLRTPEEGGEEIVSLDALLPGEAEAARSGELEDSVHWYRVYEELFAFKQSLLATLEDQRGRVERDGVHEVQNDEILLTREADRLSRRLEYWRLQVIARRQGDNEARA